MDLKQKIQGFEVLASWRDGENDGTVFIARQKYDTSPYCKFVVSRTFDGETWEHGDYFHSADYGGERKAFMAAMLRFLYRSGFTSYFNRLYGTLDTWAERGMRDLGLKHAQDNTAQRRQLHDDIRKVLDSMEVGEVRTRLILWDQYNYTSSGLLMASRTAHDAALHYIVDNSKGAYEWTTDDREVEAVIRLR